MEVEGDATKVANFSNVRILSIAVFEYCGFRVLRKLSHTAETNIWMTSLNSFYNMKLYIFLDINIESSSARRKLN